MELSITQLKFTLLPTEKIILPPHPGSTFRGAFGHALKKLTCIQKNIDCQHCSNSKMCAYSQLFNPFLTEEEKAETSNRFQNKPRPFVFNIHFRGKEKFLPGEKIKFNLIVFGKADKYIPYIIESWRMLENEGIGSNRGQFMLYDVWKCNDISGKAQRIYYYKDKEVNDVELKITKNDIKNETALYNKDSIQIYFSTPTLLKFQGEYVNKIEFHILMRNLFRRLSFLSCFYGEKELLIDFNIFLEKAKEIKITEDKTKWIEWSRYSNRQQQKVKMYGVTGYIEYQGEIKGFVKYLLWGQYINIGKNTVFGQGNYIIL